MVLASCPDQNRPGACSASSVETLRSRNRSRCISTRHARNIVVNQRAWSSLHRVCPLVVPSLLQAARSARLLSTDFYKNSPVEVRRCGGAAVRRWLRGVRPLNSPRHRIRANRSALRTTRMPNGVIAAFFTVCHLYSDSVWTAHTLRPQLGAPSQFWDFT